MTGRGALLLICVAAACAAPPDVAPPAPQPPLLRPCTAERGGAFASAECGAIRVFENRKTKQGRQISVAFARWPARMQPARGAVFFLAGGPGADGASMSDAVAG